MHKLRTPTFFYNFMYTYIMHSYYCLYLWLRSYFYNIDILIFFFFVFFMDYKSLFYWHIYKYIYRAFFTRHNIYFGTLFMSCNGFSAPLKKAKC